MAAWLLSMPRKTNRPRNNEKARNRHPIREGAASMSVRRFFQRLVRYFLCFSAGLLAFAACAYTDYRLWPLDLPAPRYPVLPAPGIQGSLLVLPFAPAVASAKIA